MPIGGLNPMRRGVLFLSCVVLILLAGGWTASGDEPALPSLDEIVAKLPHNSLVGQVVDKDGKPVKKAEVFLYYSGKVRGERDRLVGKTKSNRNGIFTFKKAVVWEPVKGGREHSEQRYTVIAKHPEQGINFTVVTEKDALDKVQVMLRGVKTHPVSVKDAQGKPIEGAKVFLSGGTQLKVNSKGLDSVHRHLQLSKDIGVSSGVTDAQGHADLMGPDVAIFLVEKEGYAQGWYYRDEEEGQFDTLLFPGAQVSGKVTYPDGTAAVAAIVRFTYQGNSLVWDTATLTDKDGHYVFNDVPCTGFRFSQMKPEAEAGGATSGQISIKDLRPDSSYVSKPVSFPIKPGEKITKDLSFEKGVVVAGKVINLSTKAPVANMWLNFYFNTGGRYLTTNEVKANEKGEFRALMASNSQLSVQWERSRDGDYIIDQEWQNQNHQQPFRGVVTKDMTGLTFEVKLWDVQPFKGRVVDASGQGVKDVEVFVHSEVPAIKTDELGNFTLKVVPKDRDFDLFAVNSDKTQAGLVTLKMGTTEATIPLEPVQPREGVVLTPDGLPAADLKFYCDLKINGTSVYKVREEPTTDKDGKFTLKNTLLKASYGVFWSSDNDQNRDYDYGKADFDLSKLAPNTPIQFEAKQYLNAIMGRVVNQKKEPIVGASIKMISWAVTQQNNRNASIVTDDKGEFSIGNLATGTAKLQISAKDFKPAIVKTVTDTLDLEVVLKPATEPTLIKATVLDEKDKPVPNIPVELTIGFRVPDLTKHSAKTNAKGIALFTLPSDDKSINGVLQCDHEGYDVALRSVISNVDADVLLPLRRSGACWTGRVMDQANKPIAGAKVKVGGVRQGEDEQDSDDEFVYLDNPFDFSSITDANGRFEIPRFSTKDSLSLNVTCEGYVKESMYVDAKRDAGKVKEISLMRGAELSGKCVVKGTNTLLPVSHVILESFDGPENGEIKEDGTFAAKGLKPGLYGFKCTLKQAESPKYVCPKIPTITITAGDKAEIVVEYEEGIPLRGKLIDKQTKELPKGTVNIFAGTNDPDFPGFSTTVNKDGTWEVYVSEGDFDLRYHAEGMKEPMSARTIKVEKGKTYDGLVIEAELPPTKPDAAPVKN